MLKSSEFMPLKASSSEVQFDTDFNNRLDDDEDDASSVKTNNQVVLLWDILKNQFRKSEEDEMARLIGTHLIQKGEDLRDEYATFYEIYLEIQETQNAMRAQQAIQDNLKKTSSIFSTNGNNKFLDQELQIFIQNLQKKAVDSGLDKDSLIPKNNLKDKQIFEFISSQHSERPQSAMTGLSSPSSKMSNSLIRDCDPAGMDQTMRSSFYSTRNGFNNQKSGIVNSLKVKNILELTPQEMLKIEQIRGFMQEQLDGLTQEIEELQKLIQETQKKNQIAKPQMSVVPSQKDLKDYSLKLQQELLQSDQNIKIHKAMASVPKKEPIKLQGAQRNSSISKIGGPVKIIPKQIIDKESPQKDNEKQIVKVTLKRGDSKSKLIKIRKNSATRQSIEGPPCANSVPQVINVAGGNRLKLKVSNQPIKKKQKENKQEIYGLDLSMLESLGLGDMLSDFDDSSPDKQEVDPNENMTYEDLRKQFDIDGQQSAVNKLRGACKQYQNEDE